MARDQKVKTKASQSQQKAATQAPKQEAATSAPKLAQAQQQKLPVEPKTAAIDTQVKVIFPEWPTSHPGPRATPVPAGMRPVNAFRPEQVCEINYNQETGAAEKLGQETLQKGKKRI